MTDALQELAALEAADSFVARHIAPTEAEIAAMLRAQSIDPVWKDFDQVLVQA